MSVIVRERGPILVIQSAVAVELQVGQEHCALADYEKPDAGEHTSAGGKPYLIVVSADEVGRLSQQWW